MDKINRRAVLATSAMLLGAGVGASMVPTKMLAETRGRFKLGDLMPSECGAWKHNASVAAAIVNPQATTLLERLYSQTLERVYFNAAGQSIMLSIAYGEDQADSSVQLHLPDVCYPAQGFRLVAGSAGVVKTAQGDIRVRRLQTVFNSVRHEQVTYWVIVGDAQATDGWSKKLIEIRHGLKGYIVDGLLFRVSSVGKDVDAEYAKQADFLSQAVGAMTPSARRFLAGL